MMRIHYAGGSELTGDEIADALMDLAEELGRAGKASSVEIPVRSPDGSIGRCRFLIGPASQIVSETEKSDLPEVRDDELVAALLREAKALRPHLAMHTETVETIGWDPDTDEPPTYQ